MSEQTQYNEKAVYTGRRLAGDKVYQRFEVAGKEIFFRGIKSIFIGYTYKCGIESMQTRPEIVADVDAIHNPEWEAQDALVDTKNAKRRALQRFKKDSFPYMKAALSALMPLCKGLDYFEREQLILRLVEATREKKT